MKKEDKQIVWKKDTGYYKGRKLFEISEVDEGAFAIYVRLKDRESFNMSTWFRLKITAKIAAECFLRRLQEAVK